MPSPLLRSLRAELKRIADPAKAPQMQAYMKSAMPYHGVPAPLLRQTCKSVFADLEFTHASGWRTQVSSLWQEAKFREERYGAIHLSGHRLARDFQTPGAMKLYEEMIVSGAWWDYVDTLAVHRVGPILAAHPEAMKKKMLAWSKSNDMWKRRTAIICQIGFKEAVDLELLYRCIEPSMDSKEFFLRKAIGWALRQVAWTDPKEITRYVRRHRDRLSGLSQREALRNLGKI
jgi:3-methyladenine DNA glycosylase AlkD